MEKRLDRMTVNRFVPFPKLVLESFSIAGIPSRWGPCGNPLSNVQSSPPLCPSLILQPDGPEPLSVGTEAPGGDALGSDRFLQPRQRDTKCRVSPESAAHVVLGLFR